ncbi:MAG: hypothetical protein HYR88_00420 [Verrucomicrobia bacterium]|nr:hypothetical protein [Verrucomicrobiota bacterium]MBI3871250.1 hypothetical protein [Verrucomicrobiota bacterium]
MSLSIKELTNTSTSIDNSIAAVVDSFNVIPTANVVYDLYTAPNSSPTSVKAAIVKGIRLANIGATAAKVNLYFMRLNATGQNRRRQLSPVDLTLQPGYLYIDDSELSLEPGDRIQGKCDTANAIQFVISGAERDVV